MSLSVFIKTFGCQMNEYDSNRFFELLKNTFNFSRTFSESEADLLVLNTCSVREKSYFKVFSILGKWKFIKETKSNVIIIILGCVAKQLGISFFSYTPFVDFVLGPQSYTKFPDLLISFFLSKRVQHVVVNNVLEKFSCLPLSSKLSSLIGFITIMEGCSKFCSYCVVPFIRGQEVSRSFDDIIVEAVSLAYIGVIEIILLGQNVNNYYDNVSSFNTISFSVLLKYVCRVNGIHRIRFMTSYPLNFNTSLINVFSTERKIAKHIHLPLQSGSNKILKTMKRLYTAENYKCLVTKLKCNNTYVYFSTDIIIGFPGESYRDFLDTLQMVVSIGFDYSYCFLYSARPGTEATKFSCIVSMNLKKKRLVLLQKYCNLSAMKISESICYSVQRILIIGSFCNSNISFGYTDNNRMVFFYSFYINFYCVAFVFIETYRNTIFFGKIITLERC